MQIKKSSNEFNSYIISPDIKVYDAYIALMSNREKTLIVADNKKVYGSLTTGDFKRKISFTLGKDILKASDLEVSQICNENFFSVEEPTKRKFQNWVLLRIAVYVFYLKSSSPPSFLSP